MIRKTNEIEQIIIKFPELASPNAAEVIKEKLLKQKEIDNDIHKYRQVVWDLEKQQKALEEELRDLSKFYQVIYKTEEIADRPIVECNVAIKESNGTIHM